MLVSTVAVFRTGASIVVTTAEENTAEELLKHRAVWESQLNLNLTQVRKNSKWHIFFFISSFSVCSLRL